MVGKSAVVLEDTNIAFVSYLYRVITNERINPETLVCYMNCKYGRSEINKNSMKGNQTNFSPAKFSDINIPEFGKYFQSLVKSCVNRAYSLRTLADKRYEEAKKQLIFSIKLAEIRTTGISVNKLSNSFIRSGRLDAEYYQPKYDDYATSLCTCDTVASLCNIYDKNFTPNNDSSYKYIELAHVGTSGEISGVENICGKDLPTRARRKVKAGQVIISSVEGSLQSCALITDEYDGALCSTEFYVLDSDSINSETLLVLFKSEPIQALIKQRCSGTILTAISKDELLSMPLPKIDNDVQKGIAVKVQESFALRQKSKQLLEYAKQAVEMAIEQGEEIALEWLKGKVDE